MSTIYGQQSQVQNNSLGVSLSARHTWTSFEDSFVLESVALTTAETTVDAGTVTTPKIFQFSLVSGDDALISFDNGATYPFRLSGSKESCLFRNNFESLREVSTVICQADTASSLSGDYFDLEDRVDTVRVWYNMAATTASGSITYGAPSPLASAIGTIYYSSPVNGDTVSVDGNIFEYDSLGAADFTSEAGLIALIDALPGISAIENPEPGGWPILITADAGTAGNSVALQLGVGNSGGMLISGSFLTGGLNGTTVAVDGTTFTFVSSSPGANEFSSIAGLTALVDALGAVTATSNGTTISIVAATAGTAGNAITLSATAGSGTTSVSGATLTGGTDISTPPATPSGGRLLPVVIAEDATAPAVATATQLALDADEEFIATVSSATVTITDAHVGARTSVADGNTGWGGGAFAVSVAGAANPVVKIKSVGESVVNYTIAPN